MDVANAGPQSIADSAMLAEFSRCAIVGAILIFTHFDTVRPAHKPQISAIAAIAVYFHVARSFE